MKNKEYLISKVNGEWKVYDKNSDFEAYFRGPKAKEFARDCLESMIISEYWKEFASKDKD